MRAINIVDHEYMLGKLIGAGGMARVYTAEDASKSRIAVKMLHPDLVVDPGMVTRLLEEATIARRVSHDNVVRVLDHGTTADGAPFLACLLYTSDAADERSSVDLGGRRIIKKKKK